MAVVCSLARQDIDPKIHFLNILENTKKKKKNTEQIQFLKSINYAFGSN